jgi:hypothetical protein
VHVCTRLTVRTAINVTCTFEQCHLWYQHVVYSAQEVCCLDGRLLVGGEVLPPAGGRAQSGGRASSDQRLVQGVAVHHDATKRRLAEQATPRTNRMHDSRLRPSSPLSPYMLRSGSRSLAGGALMLTRPAPVAQYEKKRVTDRGGRLEVLRHVHGSMQAKEKRSGRFRPLRSTKDAVPVGCMPIGT